MKKTALVLFILLTVFAGTALAARKNSPDYKLDPVLQKIYEDLYLSALKKADLGPADVVNFSIGQSHIDAAWRWRITQTHKKCLRTWGGAIEHMKKYPDFVFAGSAPQYYEWVEQDDPALFKQIQEAEKRGQWELVGGQWVEPDNNMPDGESFCRGVLLGQRYYQEKFGHISDIAWLLDSFGYNWNLPQFLAKSGSKYFWTTKLTWNESNIFPFHLFYWQAPDGSRLYSYMTVFCPLPEFYPTAELKKFHDTRYLLGTPGQEFVANYLTSPDEVKSKLSGPWVNVFGIFYGLGDGGLGPIEKEIQIQETLKDKGYTKMGTAHQLYAELDKFKDRAPVWNDELFLEFHHGCQTTHSWIKRANRQAEQMMRTAEVLRSVAMKVGLSYPYEKLKKIWKLVLLNQFHDILPGSSIPEVYEDAKEDHKVIREGASQAAEEGLDYLAKTVNTKNADASLKPVMIFNTLSWDRSGIVKVSLKGMRGGPFIVQDADGNILPSEMQGNKKDDDGEQIVFSAEKVPSLGYKVYYLKQGREETGAGPTARDNRDSITLENDILSVTLEKKNGWLTSVKDKVTGREFLRGYGNQLMAWNDRPQQYSAWNINKDYQKHPYDMPKAKKVEITSQGPMLVEITDTRKFMNSEITQVIQLYRGEPIVRMTTKFDFHDKDVLVKSGFDTTIDTDKINVDIPYAEIDRSTHPTTSWDAARWEAPCHKWIDLSDGKFGVALLNNGKYGYSLNQDGSGFRLSLLKAAHHPKTNPGTENAKKHWLTPTFITDQGPATAWTALLPHQGDWREARIWRAGYEFNTPLEYVVTDQHEGKLPPSGSFFSLDNPDVYIGAVKKSEDNDDLVLRLVDAVGKEQRAKIFVSQIGSITKAAETDLLEWNPVDLSPRDKSVEVIMKPWETKTVRITLSR